MILALDPSLKGFGYCYGDSGNLTYGVISYRKNKTLCDIRDNLEKIITENNIKHCFREGLSLGFRNYGLQMVTEIGGVIKEICARYDVELLDIPPRSVKFLFSGDGRATKEDIINLVNLKFNLTITSDDIGDAIAIHSIGESYLRAIKDCNKKFGTPIIEVNDFIRREAEDGV